MGVVLQTTAGKRKLLTTASLLLATTVRLAVAMAGTRALLDELRRETVTDALTGLGNRRRLYADLPQLVARASEEHPIAVIIFDLDGFKAYNDGFGHSAGDRLLERIAARLQAELTDADFAYRLGGDEFCVVVETCGRDPQQIARALALALGQHGPGFTVTASHGCAVAPADGRDPHSLMRCADRRMYERKHDRGRRSPSRWWTGSTTAGSVTTVPTRPARRAARATAREHP